MVYFETGTAVGSADSTGIDNLGIAFWYSLVTLTTVGYGDFTPKSPQGRIIGGIFLILSTGVLALLFSLAYSLLTGRLFPHVRLWLNRKQKWYMFYPDNDASRILASSFSDGVVIFCDSQKTAESRALHLKEMPDSLLSLPFSKQGERILFVMSEDVTVNEHIAHLIEKKPVHVYCRGEGLNESLPDNITRFNQYDCAARLYWQLQPCLPAGETVVLLGNGHFAASLLNQGLLVAPPGCTIKLFGDWMHWRTLHDGIKKIPDAIIRLNFYEDRWTEHRDLIATADRIILCSDDEKENRDMLRLLRQYYVTRGHIDVRSLPGLQNAFYFGTPEMLFTPELVMRQRQNDHAQALHEMYSREASYPVPTWSELSDFLKHSNLAAADHLLTKIRLLLPEQDIREVTAEVCKQAAERYENASPEEKERYRNIEHNRWLVFHALYNWEHNEKRNDQARQHPLMVPYEQLSETNRVKNDSAWLQLKDLAREGDL